jgi:hypothetical protein
MIAPYTFVFLIFFIPATLSAQTTISGIINKYTAVDSVINSGGNALLEVGNSSGFHYGDKVLVIQMRGAATDTTNTFSFGTITDFNSAGNYEFSRISSVYGNTIELCHPLQRMYNTNSAVQLIFVPEYNNAIVSSVLTAQTWNGSTGGVLALDVKNNLTLQANIDVSEKGFEAGQSNYYGGVNCGQTGFHFSANSTNGVDKGKGICICPVALSRGRGACANAGGGGNNHNAGGGGGSNSGIGGQGGNEWSGCGPGIANGGIGGYALSYSNFSRKIFMGGGGGAGHNNSSNSNSPGGRGGGIIIIKAAGITGNNFSIMSSGANGADSILIYDEGRGGGGGGGTMLLDVKNYFNTLSIEARGGRGGNSNTCCAGPGGGGGGGLLWYSTGALSSLCLLNLAGGSAGITSTNANFGSSAGTKGNCVADLVLPDFSCTSLVTASENSEAKTHSISIFPNPCDGKFQLRIGAEDELTEIKIYNLLGEEVKNFRIVSGEVEMGAGLKGIYFLRGRAGGSVLAVKIVIQ